MPSSRLKSGRRFLRKVLRLIPFTVTLILSLSKPYSFAVYSIRSSLTASALFPQRVSARCKNPVLKLKCTVDMNGTRYFFETARAVKFEILVWEWITQGLFSFTNLLTILYERLRLMGSFLLSGAFICSIPFSRSLSAYTPPAENTVTRFPRAASAFASSKICVSAPPILSDIVSIKTFFCIKTTRL